MSQKRLRFLWLITQSEKTFFLGVHRQVSQLHSVSLRSVNDTSQHWSNGYLKKEYRTEVMFRQLKKNLVATLIAALTIGQVAPAFADTADTLPDMGTSAGSTLSIGQEMQMGDYYVRQLRGSAPLINDPLLTQYINALRMRLVSHADSVKTPFTFFLINNDEINAFASFG
ncbi:MAG: hypothetical protein E7J44_18195, partial [Citrobacter freundii]|nr:hypothetical protein [Citrobacter freundii]